MPPLSADLSLSPKPISLLLIEDDALLLGSVKEILQFEGFRVFAFLTGGDGLAAAVASPPQAILLDIRLPDMDGLDVLRHLRQQPATRNVPIIVLSGHDPGKYRVAALELGANAFLRKPFASRELLAVIQQAIVRRSLGEHDSDHQ